MLDDHFPKRSVIILFYIVRNSNETSSSRPSSFGAQCTVFNVLQQPSISAIRNYRTLLNDSENFRSSHPVLRENNELAVLVTSTHELRKVDCAKKKKNPYTKLPT